MTFKDNEKLIIDKAIENYIKDKKRYPTLEQLSLQPAIGFFFDIISKDKKLKEEYNKYLLENFEKRIFSKNNVKMRKEFAEAYSSHKTLFQEFFILNFDRKNLEKAIFHKKWEEIQKIMEDVIVRVVWKMEWGNSKYGVFSWSVNEKFINYIKEFFPYYESIWVKIRKVWK